MSTITREQWGAKPGRSGPGPLAAREVVGLVFHWPAMNLPIRGVERVSIALRGWQMYHMSKGWSDIAYQVAVDQDGNRYILRGLDVQSAANGDEDVNHEYGAVLLVLAPGEQPTAAMIKEVRSVVADHRRLFANSDVLLGHGEVRPEPTACPGPIVQQHLEAGTFEPIKSVPRDPMKIVLARAIAATKEVRGLADARPRIRFRASAALDDLRAARDLNNAK